MPRSKGSVNCSTYKYKVTKDEKIKYFISQKEIQDEYDLRRTAVYFMIYSPERRKDHKNVVIEKLEKPLPVYNIIEEENEYGRNVKYEKIVYYG